MITAISFSKAFGADFMINYKKSDFVEEVTKLTKGRGVDLVVDSVGGSNLTRSLKTLKFRGIITFVGGTGRDNTALNPYDLWPVNATISGVFIPMTIEFERERLHEVVSHYLKAIAEKEYEVVLDQNFSLDQAAEAHQYILDKRAFGRVIMHP